MRGKGASVARRAETAGITPAHAGKRRLQWHAGMLQWDHPRACGEKAADDFFLGVGQGSPPRMRGKGRHCLWAVPLLRITPAYAGKSCGDEAACHGSWDHPRACGEKLAPPFAYARMGGSPPRMRGKDGKSFYCTTPVRITPAHAGKSI